MSDSDPKPPGGDFQKDVGVDKPGIVGARWWHKSLMDEDKQVQRRQVLIGLAVAGGAVAAISAVGVGIVKLASGEKYATRNQNEPSTRCTEAPATAVTTRARRVAMKMSVTST